MHRLRLAVGRSLVLYYLAGGLAVLAGCAGNPPLAERAIEAAYPQSAAYGPDLDVVVVRDGGTLRLVNREPKTFGPGQLWLNAAYMQPVDHIDIGSDNVLVLEDFHNGFGEHYPTGSFLRPERDRRLVLAELYDPSANVRYRLTVQPESQPGTR